jgi:anti-sigma regulatory factor (Ser/Thr protein kinase)
MLSYRLTRNLQGRLPKSQILMAQMSLQEVLINAIEHGNLEIDYEKKTQLKKMTGKYWENLLRECNRDYLINRKIFVSYSMDEEKVVYTIRDEGDGFDWERYITSDASSFGRELYRSYHGVGLQMVRRAFKISFRDRGNEVLLTKYFSESAGKDDS